MESSSKMEVFKKIMPESYIIKKSLTIALGTYIFYVIAKPDSPFYLAIGILLCFEQTVYKSYTKAKNRVLGTCLGALLGLMLGYYFKFNFLAIFGGIFFIIYMETILKISGAIPLSCIAFLYIMLHGEAVPTEYYFERVFQTAVGVTIAVIANYVIAPPNYVKSILDKYQEIVDVLEKIITDNIENKVPINYKLFRAKLNVLSNLIDTYIFEPKSKKRRKICEENLKVLKEELYDSMLHLKLLKDLNKGEINDFNIELLEKRGINIKRESEYVESRENTIYNYHLEMLIKQLSYYDGEYENLQNTCILPSGDEK